MARKKKDRPKQKTASFFFVLVWGGVGTHAEIKKDHAVTEDTAGSATPVTRLFFQ